MEGVVSHNGPFVGQQAVDGGGDWDVGLDGYRAVLAKVGGGDALLGLLLAGWVQQGDEPAGVGPIEHPLDVAVDLQRHQPAAEMGHQPGDHRHCTTVDAERHRHLIAEPEKALAIDGPVVKDLTHSTDDPRLLRKARAAVARRVERAGVALTQN